MDLSKVISIILGVAVILSSCVAQDVGRLRRMMIMRQREQALRRGLLPFGPGRPGGSGIPPPVVARLALLERQRALSNPFLRSPFGPLGSPFRTFDGRPSLSLPGPFRGPGPIIPGPGDISRFDLSTLGFDGGAPFGGTDGISAAGPSGTITSNGQTAAEFLEQTQGTVESRQPSEAMTRMSPPPPGFRPRPPGRAFTENQAQNRPNWPAPRVERRPPPLPPVPLPLRSDPGFSPPNNRQDDSMFPETAPLSPTNRGPPPLPAPRNSPILPDATRFLPSEPNMPRLPRRPRPARDDSRLQPQTPFGPQMPLPPERSRMPPRPTRPRDPRDRLDLQAGMPRTRQPSQERQMSGPPRPRVFPTVPDIVQIPAVTPTIQGQGVSTQQPVGGLTQGAVPAGGAGDSLTGPVGPPMIGPSFGFGPTSNGGFPAQGGPGSAIFPSQSAQDPITRQPGPSFADSSFPGGLEFGGESTMPMIPVFPNGPAFPFPFPGGVQFLDPSDQLFFGSSGFPTDTLSSRTTIPGFPGSGFDSSEVSDIFRPGFGFVGPSSSDSGSAFTNSGQTSIGAAVDVAGPAFTTRGQTGPQEHNFNIHFQPLPLIQQFQPMPQPRPVPEIPERQPESSQIGLGPVVVTNTRVNRPVGIANQGGFQSGQTKIGFQTGLSVQPDGLFDLSNQDTLTFSGLTHDAQNTGSLQGSDWFTSGTASDGIINLDTGIQGPNLSASTISEKTVETVVEDGFIPTTSGTAVISGLSTSGVDSTSSKPTVDITTAIQSIYTVNNSQNVVDLTVPTGMVAKETKVTMVRDAKSASRAIVDVMSGSKRPKINVVPESPFVASMKQDYSFFLMDETAPPNEMPPITFNAPDPPSPSLDTVSLAEMPPITFNAPKPPSIDINSLVLGGAREVADKSHSGFSFFTNTNTLENKPMADPVQPLTGFNIAGTTTPDNTAKGGSI